MLKRCSKCGVEKPLEDFPVRKDTKDGYRGRCKECTSEYSRKYYQTHEIGTVKKQREYYKTHRIQLAKNEHKYNLSGKGKLTSRRANHKSRARSKDTISTLTTEQWNIILRKQNNRCNKCNKKFTKKRPPTMDHIIPLLHNGDFTFETIQALCLSCNSSKHTKLDPQFIQTWAATCEKNKIEVSLSEMRAPALYSSLR